MPYSKCLSLLLQCSLYLVQQLVRVSANALLSACSLLKSLNVAFLQHCFSYVSSPCSQYAFCQSLLSHPSYHACRFQICAVCPKFFFKVYSQYLSFHFLLHLFSCYDYCHSNMERIQSVLYTEILDTYEAQ